MITRARPLGLRRGVGEDIEGVIFAACRALSGRRLSGTCSVLIRTRGSRPVARRLRFGIEGQIFLHHDS